jgi:PAS domain S-box-containing protein
MRTASKKPSNTGSCFSPRRIASLAGVTLAYILIFFSTSRLDAVAQAAVVLSIIPIIAIAGSCGLWPGLVAGLLFIPLNGLLLTLAGRPQYVAGPFFWIGHLVYVGVGVTIGLLKDFQTRLATRVQEQCQLAESLRESEERFRRIFEDGPLGMAVLDVNDRFIQANARLCEMVGYTEEELTRLTFMDITHPDERVRDIEHSRNLFSANIPRLQIEKRYLTKAGQMLWVNLTATIIRDDRGQPLYKLTMIEDITERKRAEEALWGSEERLELALRGADLGLWDWNVKTGEVAFNKRWAEMLGYSLEEIAPHISSWEELIHPDDLPKVMQILNAHLEGHTPFYEVEHRLCAKSGEWKWILDRGKVIERSPDGTPLRAAGTHLDITDRKEAEQALRASEERLRGLSEAAFEAIFLSEKGIGLDQNLAAERMFGHTLEEAVGRRVTEWIAPEDRERVMQNVSASYDQPYEVTALRKDGSTFPAEVRGKMIDYHGRQIRVTALRDITERKRTEEALRIRTEQLEALRQVTLDITAELDLNALLEALVKSALELLEVQSGGIYIYQPDRDVIRWTVAIGDDMAAVGVELKRGEGVSGKVWETGQPLIVDNYASWEGRAAIYEGHNWASTLGVPIQWGEEFLGVLNVIADQVDRFSQSDVDLLSLHAAQAAIAIKNAQLFNETRSHAAELEQRVEQRTAELNKTHERLKTLARQRDEFVTSISHELRTPLTSAKLHLHLLKSRPEERGRFMAQLDRETRRLEYIVDQLLYLSRLDLAQVEPKRISVDLNELVRLYVWDRQVLAKQRALDLSFVDCAELPHLQADPMLLERVLGILLDNAFNYTPPGGRVTVSVDKHRVKDERWALLTVEDTGPGIPLDERVRLFERFFRGRIALETGTPGSGLGLVIAKEIVEQHQGQLDVESLPGVGSKFKVLLPINKTSGA